TTETPVGRVRITSTQVPAHTIVGPNAANDIGFTTLDGQLMYQTNVGEIGSHVGTLLISDYPISGNFFFNNITNPARLPLADQIEALRGGIKRLSIGPADGRYIHAVGPITLEPDKKALLSIAVVAGESKAQLIDNAQAAAGEKPKKPKKFGGTLSTTSLEFGATLIVEPASSLPWDNDEGVRIAGLESSWIAESSVDRISFIVPRLEVGPTELRVYFQGPDQVTEYADVEVASTFTPVGTDEYANGPEISNGPFPMEYFIELSNEDPDHVLTIAPAADLDLTVTLQWMTGADLDILWRNADFTEYVGNFGGATAAKPEQTSVTVPGGETWRLWFNKWDSSAPPTLALVTIQSP
ncbi:MAG: hypothetical protein JSU87_11790, partial [Gemmatimonadota bacterium]